MICHYFQVEINNTGGGLMNNKINLVDSCDIDHYKQILVLYREHPDKFNCLLCYLREVANQHTSEDVALPPEKAGYIAVHTP